jgi:hypothetical protein
VKVSDFLREYQLTGNVPTAENPMCAFWAGWMMGNATRGKVKVSTEEAITLAIQAAEFIEAQR